MWNADGLRRVSFSTRQPASARATGADSGFESHHYFTCMAKHSRPVPIGSGQNTDCAPRQSAVIFRSSPGNIPWPGVSTFFGSDFAFAASTIRQAAP
jgi:hypothetical protein